MTKLYRPVENTQMKKWTRPTGNNHHTSLYQTHSFSYIWDSGLQSPDKDHNTDWHFYCSNEAIVSVRCMLIVCFMIVWEQVVHHSNRKWQHPWPSVYPKQYNRLVTSRRNGMDKSQEITRRERTPVNVPGELPFRLIPRTIIYCRRGLAWIVGGRRHGCYTSVAGEGAFQDVKSEWSCGRIRPVGPIPRHRPRFCRGSTGLGTEGVWLHVLPNWASENVRGCLREVCRGGMQLWPPVVVRKRLIRYDCIDDRGYVWQIWLGNNTP